MKKLYIVILSFVVIFIGLLYISSLKPSTNHFKAIYQSYGYTYKEDKKMELEIYSKDRTSIIENEQANSYYILSNDSKYLLNNVMVEKEKIEDYYLYKISSDLIKPIKEVLIIKDATLLIENNEYTLKIVIGNLSITNKHIEYLKFNDIYASYTYINGSLLLAGINIKLEGKYNRISNLSVNNITYTDTSMIIEGNLYQNEIDIKSILPNYKYDSILRSHRKITNNTLFIPITYDELIVVKGGYIIITLDGVEYLINEFDFIFNDLNIDEYENHIMESVNVKA